MVQRSTLRLLNLKAMGSNSLISGQLPHLTAILWAQPHSKNNASFRFIKKVWMPLRVTVT